MDVYTYIYIYDSRRGTSRSRAGSGTTARAPRPVMTIKSHAQESPPLLLHLLILQVALLALTKLLLGHRPHLPHKRKSCYKHYVICFAVFV